jgi:hypothetical protein
MRLFDLNVDSRLFILLRDNPYIPWQYHHVDIIQEILNDLSFHLFRHLTCLFSACLPHFVSYL